MGTRDKCVPVLEGVVTIEQNDSLLKRAPNGDVILSAANGSYYRRSVCVVIMDQQGHFLGCRRRDDRRVLQCVQGGAMLHETPQQTAEREVLEEIGLPARYLHFIGEVVHTPPTPEPRAAFRYKSKSWRSMGVVGQELYPLLYTADTNVINILNFAAVPRVRPEFCEAKWVELDELVQHSSPSKREVMVNICAAVASLARQVLGLGCTLQLASTVLEGIGDGIATETQGEHGDGGGLAPRRRRRRRRVHQA